MKCALSRYGCYYNIILSIVLPYSLSGCSVVASAGASTVAVVFFFFEATTTIIITTATTTINAPPPIAQLITNWFLSLDLHKLEQLPVYIPTSLSDSR